jgi:hypothetical protein
MNAPQEYIIVEADSPDELARKVTEKLDGGYELYGPPLIGRASLLQAMTRPNLPEGATSTVPKQ